MMSTFAVIVQVNGNEFCDSVSSIESDADTAATNAAKKYGSTTTVAQLIPKTDYVAITQVNKTPSAQPV